MSGKRKSYPVPTDKILEDNWHYEKPVTKEFSTVETPTKKKRAKVRQQPRKWAPSQHNSQILEQACGRHCKYECGSVSMDHKQICRPQVSDTFERGGRARLKNYFGTLCNRLTKKKGGKGSNVNLAYFLPAPVGMVNRPRVCRRTFYNVFGLSRHSLMLDHVRKNPSAILPEDSKTGKAGSTRSQENQQRFECHLKRYPRTTGK